MVNDLNQPVIIGVGDFVNRSKKPDDGIEPLQLILSATKSALKDTGLSQASLTSISQQIDSINVVRTWTWPYPDLAKLVAEGLDITPKHTLNSDHGGNSPALLLDEAARRISNGQSQMALVAGAEALASLSACASAGQIPPKGWTQVDQDVTSVFSPTTRELKPDLGAVHGIGNPIHIYPLYEHGFRHHLRQSIGENNKQSAKLYTDFAKIAESHPYAWSYGSKALSQNDIGSISKRNRMICLPYPLLMNAFNNVNMAAACIVTSLGKARELKVPENKLIYLLGGAGTQDCDDFWERPNFYSSPSISRSIDASLKVSGLKKEDVDLFDFYSCFPIVPKLACEHIGLSITNPEKPISLLGGLTSFGGAGNNYSLHAITEMTRQLRDGKGKNGLILANGGVVTYQHAICLSSRPRKDGRAYPNITPLPKRITDVAVPRVVEHASGAATIETFTVEYDRSGNPSTAFIVGRLDNGDRFIANHGDAETMQALCSSNNEPIGRAGTVKTNPDGRNLFTLTTPSQPKL